MSRAHLIKPILDQDYPVVTHGNGIYLYDQDGKKYLDGSSGAVTASIGHGVTEIIQAMKEQAEKVSFVYRTQFTSAPAEQLAKKLSDLSPGDLNWSFFVNSGSEATETAIKIAIQYWQEKGMSNKTKIISRWMSYHGITLGALSMSGYVSRRERFVSILGDSPTISAPYYYRNSLGSQSECDEFYAEELEQEIKRIGKDHVAAFIAEPIIGAAGAALTPSKDYYKKIKDVCDRNDILFIADEVMTGMGRTGKMFAIDHYDVVPDMIAMGKGMSAGYTPMAAVQVSDRIMKPITTGSNMIMSGHTYSANPLSSAVALAVIDYIEDHQIVESAAKNGEYLFNLLTLYAQESAIIGDVRGKGLLIGIEFVTNKLTKETFPSHVELTNLVVQTALEHGLLLYPSAAGDNGITGDAIIVSPPLVITRDEIDQLMERFSVTIEKVEAHMKKKGHIKTNFKEETI